MVKSDEVPVKTSDWVELHERLTKMEVTLEAIEEALRQSKHCDEKLEEKIDQILHNDKSKLQRIAKTEQQIKNLKFMFGGILLAVVGALVKTFA